MTAELRPVDTPLAGCTLVLTSDRRAEELTASFERRGARVLHAPTLRIVPLVEDRLLLEATERVLADPPEVVIVTTAIGLRGWIEAVDAAGRAAELIEVLGEATILARGPKARGAIRAAGLVEEWAATSETTAEIADRLIAEGVSGRRIGFQLHGVVSDPQVERLRMAGASVEAVPVYRWGPTPDPAAVQRGIEAICARSVDAVVFTSAPGAAALLDAARDCGRWDDLLTALSEDVVPAAVGSVTAGPLRREGVDPLVPDRPRLGALVRTVADHLSARCPATLPTAHGELQLRSGAALLGDRVIPLSPAPMALLRTLAAARGDVVDRARLLAVLPGATDEHAVEVTIGRLRTSLRAPGLVETVVKRGYRLVAVPDGAAGTLSIS